MTIISPIVFGENIVCDNGPGTDAYFSASSLSKEEEAAWLSETAPQSELMKEMASARQREMDAGLPNSENAIEIPWNDAKRMVLLGFITKTMQGHNKVVYLESKSGKVYRASEPKIDNISAIIRIVDPCHIHVLEATE